MCFDVEPSARTAAVHEIINLSDDDLEDGELVDDDKDDGQWTRDPLTRDSVIG